MKHLTRWWRSAGLIATMLCVVLAGVPNPALAENTGTIAGFVRDADSGAPIADALVTAASPSAERTTHTNSRGYYTLEAMIPDTYTVSFQAQGYTAQSEAGVTVQQGIVVTASMKLSKTLATIANVHARSAGSLVKPNVAQDEYTVTGEELNAVSGGNNMHKTLYQYIQAVPGVTATGYAGQPRIHGGAVTDEQYEFDGIPIRDRMTGFFTTNLSNVGIGNVEVYTGGLNASQAASGLGIINTVVKTGTYPAYGVVTYGTAADGSRLNDLTVEYGGATPNRKFSWYMGLDKTDSLNEWASGLDYNTVINVEGGNPPGQVKTTDVIGNFHYRPSNADDFQFLIQNGIGDFIFNDGLIRSAGQVPPVTAMPCPGYVLNPNTASGASGGTAPDGQTCPIGLYFGTANTQSGGGNFWHHYSGIGKLQWNHILNDHSFFAARISENFNQYIFDQPIVDDNVPALDNSTDFDPGWGLCAVNYPSPYLPGTPINEVNVGSAANPYWKECQQQQNWFSTGYFGDRRSNMWLGSLDYTNNISENTLLKAGISQEYDNNLDNSYFSFYFNPDGSWPGINSVSNYPDHVTAAYVDLTHHFGKLMIDPGVMHQTMSYDYPTYTNPVTGKVVPAGPLKVGIWNPTFSFAYNMGLNDVIRGSYTDSTSFVGTSYVFNEGAGAVGSSVYNPGGLFSANPTIIHSYDLSWEHQFNSDTSLRIGPYFNKASDIYQIIRPVTSIGSNGQVHYGPARATNSGFRQSMGAELGFSHVDRHPIGVSYWLAATYDNFWANSTQSLVGSYGGSSNGYNSLTAFPPVRNSGDPLFSATLTADLHKDALHLYPILYYQGPSFYQTGQCAASARWQGLSGVGTPYFTCAENSSFVAKPAHLLPELMSNGYWMANLAGAVDIGDKKDLTIGMSITNLFDNTHDTTPCWVTQQVHTPALSPGCAPFYPTSNNPGPALKVNSYQYQNYSQTPTQIQFWITKKIP